MDLISSSSFYLNKVVEEKNPDLIVQDISWDKGSPKQGDKIIFTVKIKNRGDGNAGTSTVKYYIDGSDVDSDTVPSLSAGSTSTQTFTWTADKCGDVQVKTVADALGEIEESNEENNQSTETVNVVCPKKQVHNINTGKDFSSIQAAINDSDTSPGNTITVDAGTYTENVDVTKSLTIKSTSGNPADTIVQAAVSNQNYQNVFTVTADNVHIDGFTIKGASYFWCSGILLDSNNCIISNNTFEGNAIGIWIHPPSLGNNVIRNNKFSSSSGYSPSTALYLEAANNKIYLNNFIIGMEWGSGNVWNSPTQITYEYEGNTFTNYLGNYWDDYRDTDANGDGIWGHPYSIDEDKDNYPLVKGFENYKEINQINTINFSGHTWSVRHSSESPQGPGNNYWSNRTENIWVDDEGQLHLKITYNRRNGKWYCPEIFSQESFGYGKYVFYVASRVDNFDENVVGGLFTYEGRGETTPKEYEIDIEFSRWGVETNNNSLHVFQYRIADGDPATDDEPNEIDPNSFNISLNGEYSTHTFVWKNDYLHFQSYHGHYDNLPSEDYLISEKIWEDTRIPPESEEKVHLNLWLVNGNPPSDPEQSVEIIIKKFDVLSISVEGRSEGCEDYAPLNAFFREAEIPVQHDLDGQEYMFVGEQWEDKNRNLIIEANEFKEVSDFSKTTDKDEFTMKIPEYMPIGLYRLKIRGTDDVSNYFWVIFNATDSGLSEENVQNYWKDEMTGEDRVGLWGLLKKEVKTSHHNPELMICMASASCSAGYVPDTERDTLENFEYWLHNHLNETEGVDPPSDIMSYFNEIKVGHEPDADCNCFASFGVSLARAAGIPAREITGTFIEDNKVVPQKHSWIEAYYYGAWQVWDPAFKEKFQKGESLPYSHYLLYTHYLKKHIDLMFYISVKDELKKGRWFDYSGKTKPQTMIHLSCPVNTTITDQYGRIISDDGTNEIPDSDMLITKETKIFYLPADLRYSVDIDAYDTGTFNFTRVSPIGNDISITKFENIPVTSNTKASVEIEPGVTEYTMSIDYNGDETTDEKKSPDVSETIEVTTPTTIVFEDDFGELNLDNWIPFGSPSPCVLASAEGRTGVFDNNGDANCNSGVVSKDNFSFSNGFTMESDMYLKVTNVGGCWNSPIIGLTRQNEPTGEGVCPSEDYPMGVIFGTEYDGDACWGTPPEKRRHAYFIIGLYTEEGTWESVSWLNADDYTDAWHNFKIAVGSDRIVKFYVDNDLIYTSEKRVNETMLQEKKIFLGIRSSGSAGKSYHDYVKVYSGIGGEKESNVRFKGIAYCDCRYWNDGYGIEVTNILSDPDGKLAIGNSVCACWAEDTLAQINNISLGDVVEVCGSLKEYPDITEGWKVVFLESPTHHLKLIRTGNPSKLDIEIASDKKIYAPNDAVTIMITVTNTGNEPISLIVDHYSQVSLIDPYGEIIGRGHPSIKGNFITLSKGDHATLTANLRIIEDAREGYYDVKVSLSDNKYVKTAKDLFFVKVGGANTTPPIAISVEQSNESPGQGEDVTITAHVADNVGVTSVTLGYETTEVAMTLESGDVQNCCTES